MKAQGAGFTVCGRRIGPDAPPFVIAEMSGNHKQSLERAMRIVEAAAKAGVDAVKLQTYTADTMTLDLRRGNFLITDRKNLWKGKSLYDLYREASTPWEWHKPVFDRCKKLGLIYFSTPFDGTAVDFLESLGVPMYKIASFENTDIPLIRKVASTGKPVIISTGMASRAELRDAVSEARKAGCRRLVLLKCTTAYPAFPESANYRTIPDLRRRFKCEVGVSDHSIGIGAALAGIALGATVIEKHMTLSRDDGAVDSAFSAEEAEMGALVKEGRNVWKSLGRVSYGPTPQERAYVKFRRSLYVVCDMRSGEAFTSGNVRAIRPGLGLEPKFYDRLMGKRAARDIKKGTPFKWDLIR